MEVDVSSTRWLVVLFVYLFAHLFQISADDHQDVQLITKDLYLEDNLYFYLVEPETISFGYKIRPAKDFGTVMNTTMFNIELVPSNPLHACSELTNSAFMRGSIALIERGGCSFLSKTINAENSGAVAAIITDHDHENDDHYIDMIQDETDRITNIPSFFLLGKDGYKIRTSLDELGLQYAVINIPVNMTGQPYHSLKKPPWTLW